MALTAKQLFNLQREAESKSYATNSAIRWTKAALNAAVQAISDTLDGDVLLQRSEVSPSGTGLPLIVSARIDAATSPFGLTLTNAEKKWLAAFVYYEIYVRDK